MQNETAIAISRTNVLLSLQEPMRFDAIARYAFILYDGRRKELAMVA